jgi:hypothetical protein
VSDKKSFFFHAIATNIFFLKPKAKDQISGKLKTKRDDRKRIPDE